jgi:sugar phosphate isomerase/epimerase
VTDDHLPPGEGALDWRAIAATLQRSGYRGTFLLEVSCGGEIQERVQRAAASVSRLPGAPPVS